MGRGPHTHTLWATEGCRRGQVTRAASELSQLDARPSGEQPLECLAQVWEAGQEGDTHNEGSGNIRDQHCYTQSTLTSPKAPPFSSSVKCWWKAGVLWAVTPISTNTQFSPREEAVRAEQRPSPPDFETMKRQNSCGENAIFSRGAGQAPWPTRLAHVDLG